MADNVSITPGSGAVIAAEQLGDGSYVQRVKPTFSVTDTATDVSAINPMPVTEDSGTLLNRIENLTLAIHQLAAMLPGGLPDPMGRTRVSVDAGTLPTVTTVTTVATVATVTSMTGLKGMGVALVNVPLDLYVQSSANLGAAHQRDRIAVS